jgi:hypothetical protein
MERGGALFPKPTAILYCLISDPDTCIGGEQGRLPASGAPNLTMHLCIFQVGIFRPQVLDSALTCALSYRSRTCRLYIYRGLFGSLLLAAGVGKGGRAHVWLSMPCALAFLAWGRAHVWLSMPSCRFRAHRKLETDE